MEVSFPEANAVFLSDNPLGTTTVPLPAFTHWTRLHIHSVSLPPCHTKSLSSALTAGTSSRVTYEHHHLLISLLHTQNLIIQKETQLFLLQNTCRKRAGNFAPFLPSASVPLWASTQMLWWMLLGRPAGTAATSPPATTLQPFPSHENLPAISVNPWSSGGDFITEKESDVISFTTKESVIKRHLNCSGGLWQPGVCQVCQVTASTGRATGFVFGFAQIEAFGECLNHWIRLLSWHTAFS